MDASNRRGARGQDSSGQATILPGIRTLGQRLIAPEWLDVSPSDPAKRNLHEIARINRWFGGHRCLLQLLRNLVQSSDHFSVLDVGAASGDMGTCIREHYKNAAVVSLDRRIFHLEPAHDPRVVAEAAALPFRDRAFDFVLCSLLLHHYSNECAAGLVRDLLRIPRQALIVLDLERHPVPYSFLQVTRPLFGWSALTIHDGCISVAASFKPGELHSIAKLAGATKAMIQTHRPWFRISAIISP